MKVRHAALVASSALLLCAQRHPTQTTEPLNYYVSQALGNEGNTCTSPTPPMLPRKRTGPCKTIQAAIDKIPKFLRHVVTVSVAPGYYDGFVVEGFQVYPSATENHGKGAGLIIQGSTKPAKLQSGRSTGAASSPCDGGGFRYLTNKKKGHGWVFDANVHSTLVDSSQEWTPGDLRGRKLCLTTGSGKDECLAIEDNDATTVTLAGYWSDFHAGWWYNHDATGAAKPIGTTLNPGCLVGDTYEITEADTHLYRPVPLPQGIGGVANGQKEIPGIAAILVSNVHGGASATAGNGQPADNFQILIKDFDVVADDWPGKCPSQNCVINVVHSIAYVDSSDHVGFKHFTAGVNSLNPAQQHRGLYSGAGLFVFRNSTAWTVQSSYAKETLKNLRFGCDLG